MQFDVKYATADALYRHWISEVWHPRFGDASALTQQERRAVERFVSQHYTNPLYQETTLCEGWPQVLQTAWIGPRLYGLA